MVGLAELDVADAGRLEDAAARVGLHTNVAQAKMLRVRASPRCNQNALGDDDIRAASRLAVELDAGGRLLDALIANARADRDALSFK